jgi:cell division protein FtsI (penicillin-binding protein 3)
VAENTAPVWRSTLKRRLLIAAGMLMLWALAVQARLVYLQIVKYDEMVRIAKKQQSRLVNIPGRRGDLLDRNGNSLALNADAFHITGQPDDVKNVDATVQKLCGVLGCKSEEKAKFTTMLNSRKKNVILRWFVEAPLAERVQQLDLDGIGFVAQSKRYYPNGDFASHVLGFVNNEGEGASGLESAYEKIIRGNDGVALITKDASRTTFSNRLETAPTTGATLQLTIDPHVQWVLERELRAAYVENRAQRVSGIVQDPGTGKILGMASYPAFDPNKGPKSSEELRNPVVEDLFEPGSAFKVVTASAALQEGIVSPDDVIDVSDGEINVGGDVVHDTHRARSLTFTDVIVTSSNVGAITVGLKLGPKRMAEWVERFGFGRRASGRDFPLESVGMVTKAAKLKESALAHVSMGYEVGVTPLQMAAAVSSIANGGELLEPRIVEAVIQDGVKRTVPRVVVNHTVSPEVAAELTRIMEGVVNRGTATFAQIPGYSVAGKTGTAAKVVNHRYSKTEYNATFVGFVPSRKPVYTIVVVTDSPHGRNGYYGGPVSGPVFKRIAEDLLRYNGVQRTFDPPPALVVQPLAKGPREIPASGPAAAPVIAPPPSHDATFPDVIGLSMRDAMVALGPVGLAARVHGSGLVVDQRPPAGTPLRQGTPVTLWLTRDSPVSRTPDSATQ